MADVPWSMKFWRSDPTASLTHHYGDRKQIEGSKAFIDVFNTGQQKLTT